MDPELRAYLDERFRETSRELQDFREEITQGLQGFHEETTQQLQGLREETTQQITSLRGELTAFRGETNQRFEQIDGRFERVEESIRHTQISVEGLRHDIQLVAEGVVGNQEALEAFRAEVAKEFKEVRATQSLNFSELDRRVSVLEGQITR